MYEEYALQWIAQLQPTECNGHWKRLKSIIYSACSRSVVVLPTPNHGVAIVARVSRHLKIILPTCHRSLRRNTFRAHSRAPSTSPSCRPTVCIALRIPPRNSCHASIKALYAYTATHGASESGTIVVSR